MRRPSSRSSCRRRSPAGRSQAWTLIRPASPQAAAGDCGGKTLSALLASGLKAVHDADPAHETKTIIHLPDGGDNALYQRFFDMLTEDNGVNDFDIIGLSYYPFWHGTLNQLQANINDISQRYNKDVIVVETAYGYTTKNFDQMANEYSAGEARRTGFEPMVQGQAGGLRALMARVAAVPNGRGLGVFYWEPDWYAVDGVGWKTGAGNNWAKTPFTFNVYQELTDLPDGVYAAEVTTQGKGDAKSFDRYVIGDNGEKKTAAIQDSGWTNWRTVRIDGITIKGGKATVGIEQQGNGDNWGSIDNVKSYRKS
ncbi:MAG: glycosyl hydrolase 53 family protein [Selenomonas sp.]|nr:glycosyl hydrolase 53 family protein [Selenomonas sp.]